MTNALAFLTPPSLAKIKKKLYEVDLKGFFLATKIGQLDFLIILKLEIRDKVGLKIS